MRFCFEKLKLERSKSGNQLNFERENRNFHGILFLFRHSRWILSVRKFWFWRMCFSGKCEFCMWKTCWIFVLSVSNRWLFFSRFLKEQGCRYSIQKFWENFFDLIFCDILNWLPQIWTIDFVKMGRKTTNFVFLMCLLQELTNFY